MQGLIIENTANLYKIKVKNINVENNQDKFNLSNEIYNATPRGKFKQNEITPVVGDIVEISVIDEENKTAVIEKIEERKKYIKRPKMANITQIIFVVSSKDPKPDLLMLDKQLAFAEFIGIKCLIVLNKTDLDCNSEFVKISKYIEFIKLFKSIKNQMEIKPEIKKKFEEKFGLIYDNEKVLIMTFDGNYNEYLNFLKYSKIFQNEKDNKSNIIEDNITFNELNYNEINNMNSINCCNFDKNMDAHNNMSQNMLNKIKNSGINCFIIHVPRANVNVKSNYSINSNEFLELKKDVEKLKNNVIDLTNDTNLLKEKVRKLEKEIKM